LRDITIGTIFALFLFVLTYSFVPVEARSSINIFQPPPDSKPYGLSYEQHVENFYDWLISVPSDENPSNDPTGQNCAKGQENTNSSVFYLVGGGGGKFDKTCKVPAGKAIFIPVMSVEVSDKEVPNASVDDLHKLAKKDQDSITSLFLKIGDKEYSFDDLKKYRVHTGVFEVVFPENAIFGATPGPSKAVADGHHVITEKLAKGIYTINYKGSLICPGTECLAPNFAEDVKFTLIVE
jgi:hypothetical protein